MRPGPKCVSRRGPVQGRGGRWERREDTSEGSVLHPAQMGVVLTSAPSSRCVCDSHRRGGTPTVCQVLALGATASSTGRRG